jgi:hypothetical protein
VPHSSKYLTFKRQLWGKTLCLQKTLVKIQYAVWGKIALISLSLPMSFLWEIWAQRRTRVRAEREVPRLLSDEGIPNCFVSLWESGRGQTASGRPGQTTEGRQERKCNFPVLSKDP